MPPLRLLDIVLVALGSGAGGVARYLLGGWIAQRTLPAGFPWGTLIVNVSGCLLIGLIAGVLAERPSAWAGWRPLLVIGFLGGYTTFSTLLHDSWRLDWRAGLFNFLASGMLGYGAVVLGAGLAPSPCRVRVRAGGRRGRGESAGGDCSR
jgi:CrcB protein